MDSGGGDQQQLVAEGVPSVAAAAVLVSSTPLPEDTPVVKGYDFNEGIDYHKLFETYKNSGFQATNFGLAVEEINKMLAARDQPLAEEDALSEDEFTRRRSACTVFLGYTSNMASAGVRDTIRFLVQHRMVDCVVTTAGGVEEDLIKCLAPTYVGSFELDGASLRKRGINRARCGRRPGSRPVSERRLPTPSSVLYWAARNRIPVFSPALTDGSLGDMMFFHSYKRPGLGDLRRLNSMAIKAQSTGMVIIGGGLVKHHICNANLMRNGADYSVFLNTAAEFDGSDSGARPDEAVSWGKIRPAAKAVKICAEASLVFPLLVGETFARHHFSRTGERQEGAAAANGPAP
ncbi:putative deoxyhypusine synthase [Amphibalanus amphitrite]|uniref:Deoxyhypusine synthase n=1 Tax=Amphibalanus amphitrite TaxID=1232801 RepID=A0A6A4WBT4_AMPAM|nr:putative deoxyhypusine synthase [Amphibalanus amphitrite]